MFKLPELSYSFSDMCPLYSEEAVEIHYLGHHKKYIDNINKAITKDSNLRGYGLVPLMRQVVGPLSNQLGQAWNHTFFWNCISPVQTTATIPNSIAAAIDLSFGSIHRFLDGFSNHATELFGSGWLWLTSDMDRKDLRVELTTNAGNPILSNRCPLLVCDLWEHSYYVDYRNEQSRYLKTFCRQINWNFVADNFDSRALPDMSRFMDPGVSDNRD